MENTSTTSEKLFIGLGVITVISGILLALGEQGIFGLFGSAVGLWLIAENWKKLKAKTKE